MEILEKNDTKIIFKTNASASVMNAIRRSIGEVPTLAVEEVEISRNDGPLYDETIAHRIGLIPLVMKKKYKEKDEVKLKLSVKNEGIVYAKELKGTVPVAYEGIPITHLRENQELNLVAKAKLGKGKDHSKHNPGTMFYRNITELTMSKDFLSDVKKFCPNANIKESGDKITVIDDQAKEVLDVCEGLLQQAGKEINTKVKDELIVTIESFGQMPVKDIFDKAIEELEKDLKLAGKALK
jgi:DNA-directed RNA polymerase subunit D